MDGAEEEELCRACGCTLRGEAACAVCGTRARGVVLTVLPGQGVADAPTPPNLVRQLKMPTVENFEIDPASLADGLREPVYGAAAALADDDLEAADTQLDAALACVLAGPGHQRRSDQARRIGFVPAVLWVWCAVLAVLTVLGWLGALWFGSGA